jgi:hypothetical protein
MTKQRFSFISVIAMIVASYKATGLASMWRENLWIGFPFRYLWWRDTSDHWWQRYDFWALTGDLLFWLVVVIGIGLMVERIVRLFHARHEQNAA